MSNVATDHVQMVYSDPHWDELRKENEVLKSSVSALKDAIEAQIYHFEAQMNNEDCGPWYEAVQDAKKLILDASTNSDVLREVTPQEAARVLLANRWGGYGNSKAMQAMCDYVHADQGRMPFPPSFYDGVMQAGLRAIAQEGDT